MDQERTPNWNELNFAKLKVIPQNRVELLYERFFSQDRVEFRAKEELIGSFYSGLKNKLKQVEPEHGADAESRTLIKLKHNPASAHA